MASSHSGEDVHVRTLQAVYRRANVSQTVLACGNIGVPLDALTAARLARDGERAGPIRHMCSGQHSSMILLARIKGWPLEDYWQPEHPSQEAFRAAVAAVFRTTPERLVRAIDGCGIETYAFSLAEVAGAYAFLADPAGIPAGDPRTRLAASLTRIRDAMLEHPEMVAGSRERLDTSLMKAVPGRVVSKGGMEALRGVAILGSGRRRGIRTGPQDRRWRWTAARNMGGNRRGPPPGRDPRRRTAAPAGPLPPAGLARSARTSGRRGDRRVRARAGGRADRVGRRGPPKGRMTPATDPYRIARAQSRCDARRDQARLPPAGQGLPPRQRGRTSVAAIPGDPGRLRAADRGRSRRQDRCRP